MDYRPRRAHPAALTTAFCLLSACAGPVDQPPSLQPLSDAWVAQGETLSVIFTVVDEEPSALSIDAASTNQALVADADLSISGMGEERRLGVVTDQAAEGTTVITLTAVDGAALQDEASFTLSVGPAYEGSDLRLSPEDALSASGGYGRSVAISDDLAVVGSPIEASTSGAAYVYRLADGVWSEEQRLTAPTPALSDAFGTAVAVGQDTVFVGARHDDDTGSVNVYSLESGAWQWQQTLTAGDAASGQEFGSSLAVSGEWLLVGAPGDDGSAGAAYAFRFDGSQWLEVDKLVASDAAANATFGRSLAVDGETAVIGADGDSEGGAGAGAAYVFEVAGDDWGEVQKLTAAGAAVSDRFGAAVALNSDWLLVGAPRINDSANNGGAAIVFRRGATWTEDDRLYATDAADDDLFGLSVALVGNQAVVSAYLKGASTGAAYSFRRDGAVWLPTNKLVDPGGSPGDEYGYAVAMDAARVIIGAPGDVGGGDDIGSAHVRLR